MEMAFLVNHTCGMDQKSASLLEMLIWNNLKFDIPKEQASLMQQSVIKTSSAL